MGGRGSGDGSGRFGCGKVNDGRRGWASFGRVGLPFMMSYFWEVGRTGDCGNWPSEMLPGLGMASPRLLWPLGCFSEASPGVVVHPLAVAVLFLGGCPAFAPLPAHHWPHPLYGCINESCSHFQGDSEYIKISGGFRFISRKNREILRF